MKTCSGHTVKPQLNQQPVRRPPGHPEMGERSAPNTDKDVQKMEEEQGQKKKQGVRKRKSREKNEINQNRFCRQQLSYSDATFNKAESLFFSGSANTQAVDTVALEINTTLKA